MQPTNASAPPLDPRVTELLEKLVASLEPLGVPYAVGGALAMHAHGLRRYTSDVDAFALAEDRPQVLRALRAAGLRITTLMEPFHYAATLPAHGDLEVRIDVLFPAGEPELSAIEHARPAQFGPVAVRVFPLELLVAAKFYSDRLKDEADIAGMLNAGLFDPDEVERFIASIDAEGAREFRALIARLAAPRPPRPRPGRKPRG
jgi:hypothetical protein